jgi:hypothetical protein
MNEYQSKKQELAERSANALSAITKETDLRDFLIEHANLPQANGKTNLQAVMESFTNLATSADSEQVRSQTATQYLKFLAKNEEEKGSKGSQPLNLQININPVKAETTID